MANKAGLAAIKEGKQALAKYRAANASVLLDLTEADLQDADLRGMNLRRVLLVGAKLARADLTGAILLEADLTRANLKQAKLAKSDLHRANLFKAQITEADATDADFRRANLTSVDFSKSNLSRASFVEADLSKVELSDAKVFGTDFSLSKFADTHASRLQCGWTRFGNCDLTQVTGLETASHVGPSSIGLDTWLRSRGQIPADFLLGSGLPVDVVSALKASAVATTSCFIRFSHEDLSFSERLAAGLRQVGIVCWLDEMPDAARSEPPLEAQYDSQLPHKVILLASKNSLTAAWVEAEVGRLLDREQQIKKETNQEIKLLLPLILDGYLFGGDAKGKHDKAIAAHVVADFNGWRRNDTKFDEVLPKVLITLGAQPRKPEAPKDDGKGGAFGWFRKKETDE